MPQLTFGRFKRELPRGRRSGGVLLLALVSVTAVTMLGAGYLQLSASTTRRQVMAIDNKRAFYLAESGLAEAYAGMKVGKTGNVGTEADPAKFGEGLLWVVAQDIAGTNSVRLTSVGMAGCARVELSFVLEKGKEVPLELGMFSDDPLVIQPGTIIDGYESEPVAEALPGSFAGGVGLTGGLWSQKLGFGGGEGGGELGGLNDLGAIDLNETYAGGGWGTEKPPEVDDGNGTLGVVGSNGNITVDGVATAVDLQVNVIPGAEGEVIESGTVTILGSDAPRQGAADFPAVTAPDFPSAGSIDHAGRVTLVVPGGDVRYDSFRVRPNCDVQINGPAQLVLGNMVVQAGATLTIDASAGRVEIWVEGILTLATGSGLNLVGDDPRDVGIIKTGTDAVTLGAASTFYGWIYAPDAALTVGADFEMSGALVSKSLTLPANMRFHCDQSLAVYAAYLRVPKHQSWRVLDMAVTPSADGNGLASDPFDALGLDPNEVDSVEKSHEDQHIVIKYVDVIGDSKAYEGMESDFDWADVRWVLGLTRRGRSGDDRDVLNPSFLVQR